MLYRIHHISNLYSISHETSRIWAMEFAPYLSPTATPGKNRHRLFTEKDMQVFSLVSAFKKQGLTYADIHAALQSGQRGEAPALPADELESIVSNDRDRRLARENEYLQQSLARAQEDLKAVAALREELQETQEKNVRLEIELGIVKAQQERLERTVRELSRELGREYAKGFTDAWHEKGNTPTQSE